MERDIEECLKEIRALKRDLYGDVRTRQKGVFDRLEHLEEKLQELRGRYEVEKVEKGHFEAMERRLEELSLNYRVTLIYLKSIAWGGGTVLVTMLGAAVVGILRFLSAGAP